MKQAGRIAVYIAGAILGLLAAALLAVNLYVQSHATQARIQKELSQRLGTELRIRRISVTPWWGLKLTGITIPQEKGTLAGDFLRADTFRLRIAFGSLFSGRLIIKEISLVNPSVLWAQNGDGKWRLPATLPEEPAKPMELPPPAATQETERVPAPPASEPLIKPRPAPVPAMTETAAAFTPEIRRVNLANGNFRFLDFAGKPVATFERLGFRSSFRNSTELRGNASISKISLRNRFFLQDLKSPVEYDPNELEFSQISAHAAGGDISGSFSMRPAEPGSPFEAKVRFRDVQADRVVTEAGGPAGMVQGKIEGSLDASGKTADENALAGTGEIYLRGGQVRQYSLLVALGQLLQIAELSQLRLDQAQVKYHITPGVVMIDELLLTSPSIRLSATGTVSFAGKLRLDSQLAVDEKIRGQLFRGMRESFHPINVPGYAAVDFRVTGTVERPKTNLMEKLMGRDLRDLGGIINDLLGGKSERREKKKTPADAAPPAAGSPTPVDEVAPVEPESAPVPPAAETPAPSPEASASP